MSELLSIIDVVPARSSKSSTVSPPNVDSPHVSSRSTNSIPTVDANVSSSSLEALEVEDGGLNKARVVVVISVLTGVSFLSSLTNGFIAIGLPRIAFDLSLPAHLIIWPSAVYPLTISTCLILAGSIADVIGNRNINLAGCALTGGFILACGLAHTGIEFIMFRVMQGVAVALCLPTSVAIVSRSVPAGRSRNIAFSCLGFVQPIGFSIGMVLEGVVLDTVGWRFLYYLSGSLCLALFAVSLWALPHDPVIQGSILTKLRNEIDWVGAFIISTCLAVFSYVLATLSDSVDNIRHPVNIVLLVGSVALILAFILWQGRRERLNLPALIPNSLWRNKVFTSVCLTVLLTNAVANAMETFCSLFFQKVQHVSAFGAAIRILPSLVVGFCIQLTTGLIIHRTSPFILVLTTLALSAGAPLLMAVISPRWPYWYAAFPAQLLSPMACDIMFTIGLLAVSEGFPADTQALAGAVFNTVNQFGQSIGLTLLAVVSAVVTKKTEDRGKGKDEALFLGFQAGFWTAFALGVPACLVGGFGLRHMGKIGVKRD
ncbi:putative MFS-type transporter [Lachnellula willkommii]|uniref:Putative MFS-type transporter n=1 Tax=Lachnellula willkommii TaxID=215461 RepID=A0A559MKM2_9HELO|nr:putative MFS-type transporter [Lachnellula willkommii]